MPQFFLNELREKLDCCFGPYELKIDVPRIYAFYIENKNLSQTELNSEIMKRLATAYDWRTKRFKFAAEGMHDLCRRCFAFLMGVSLSTMDNRCNEYVKTNGTKTSWSRLRPSRAGTISTKVAVMKDWFRELIKFEALPLVDSPAAHLPEGRKMTYYRRYCHDRVTSTFLRIWRTDPEFRHIRVPKRGRLGKCRECISFREEYTSTRDKQKQAEIHEKRSEAS